MSRTNHKSQDERNFILIQYLEKINWNFLSGEALISFRSFFFPVSRNYFLRSIHEEVDDNVVALALLDKW